MQRGLPHNISYLSVLCIKTRDLKCIFQLAVQSTISHVVVLLSKLLSKLLKFSDSGNLGFQKWHFMKKQAGIKFKGRFII